MSNRIGVEANRCEIRDALPSWDFPYDDVGAAPCYQPSHPRSNDRGHLGLPAVLVTESVSSIAASPRTIGNCRRAEEIGGHREQHDALVVRCRAGFLLGNTAVPGRLSRGPPSMSTEHATHAT